MTYSLEACRGCGPAIILPVGAIDDLHTAGGESMPQPLVVRRVYRAAQIPDDGDAQTVAHRILGAPSHTEIAREATYENLARTGVDAKLSFEMPPGVYGLREVVEESVGGALASSTNSVDLR